MLFTWSRYLCRRRPTLPHTFACSTIGPAGLDFRVRDGNGYFPRGKITGFAGAYSHPISRKNGAQWGPRYKPSVSRPQAWVTRTTYCAKLVKSSSRGSSEPQIPRGLKPASR